MVQPTKILFDLAIPFNIIPELPITEKQFYKIMHNVGNLLNINYLDTYAMHKTVFTSNQLYYWLSHVLIKS